MTYWLLLDDNEVIPKIITDEPTKEAPDFTEYSQKLCKIIINSDPRFTVGIYGDWGTGKTTLMQMIKEEIDNKYSNNATTIWFDSWRYEREEYSLMIPLLRTIIISLHKVIDQSCDDKKKVILHKVQKGFVKIIKAVIWNTDFNIGDISKVGAGITTNFGKILDEYSSEGSVMVDQKKISFHQHISDNLKEELDDVREKLNPDFRLVIFIDDLDRCTPDRALEILESIKTFFDIKGIIYVIGMDPLTIDPIIKTKYRDNPKIDGMNYLQKIVQLPFQIPVWSSSDLSNMIGNLVKKAGLSESYSKEILKDTNQELIIKATRLNPRDIKRFINSIVLAREVYDQDIKNVDKLIAIQAFYFHGPKWIEFLKLLIPYYPRINFLTHFITFIERELKDTTILDDLNNILKDDNYIEKKAGFLYNTVIDSIRKNRSFSHIFDKLIEMNDNDLFVFLKIASVPLLEIDKMENYLRLVDTTGLTSKMKDSIEIDSKIQLKFLNNEQVREFSAYKRYRNIKIHLPYAVIRNRQLPGVDLDNATLFHTDFWGSNLSNANFYGSYLVKSRLGEANLTNANFTIANLAWSELISSNLSGANFERSNLSGANLVSTDLSGANLVLTDLSGANLVGANLSNADLANSIMLNNTFSEKEIVVGANFENAIIDNHEFIKYLHNNNCKNIPEEIKNKQELRSRLERENIDRNSILILLDLSKLPSI